MVYGTVPRSNDTVRPPTASYVLDANPPTVTTEAKADTDVSNQPLFFADLLSTDEHELTITSVGNGGFPTAPYILQRFFIFPQSNTTQKTVNNTTTSSSPTSLPPSSSTPEPSSTSSSSRTVPILAGTLGSLLVLILLLILFFYAMYHRRHLGSAIKPPKLYKADTTASSVRGLQGAHLCSSHSRNKLT